MSAFTSLFGVGRGRRAQRPAAGTGGVATYASDPDVQNMIGSRQRIRSLFANISPERYADIRRRRVEMGVPGIVEERERQDRELGFDLARTGQYGSSQDIEGRKLIDRAAIEQARELEQSGLEAADALRAADARAELGLTDAAGGMARTGSAIDNALAALRANQEAALRYGGGQVAGQAVANLASLYPAWRTGVARRRAQADVRRMIEAARGTGGGG